MLTIRDEQLRELKRCVLEAWVPELAKEIDNRFGQALRPNIREDLENVVRQAVMNAWQLGFETRPGLAAFAAIACTQSPDFHKNSKVREILLTSEKEETDRLIEALSTITP